jgi:general stress protein 26
MTRDSLLTFLRAQKLAVVSTVSPSGDPQGAVVGIGVTDDLAIVFDTLSRTRKCQNLRKHPRVAVVIGWDDEQTVQLEGLADEPSGEDLATCKRHYFEAYPDGPSRESWEGITYVRVRPEWVRYSDYRGGERIVEWGPTELRSLAEVRRA